MATLAACWRGAGDRLLLFVRATPRAGREAIEGIERRDDGKAFLRVKLRAAPADGEANEALRRLLAKTLKIPAGSLSIVAGETARTKTLSLPLAAAPALARLVDSQND